MALINLSEINICDKMSDNYTMVQRCPYQVNLSSTIHYFDIYLTLFSDSDSKLIMLEKGDSQRPG